MMVVRTAKWNLSSKRPYTEVCFITVYTESVLTKATAPLLEAKVAFEELEKAVEQIEKDVSTLAEALQGLFPSTSDTGSGSQTK
jgi:predicted ATP-grasp superfamily ATP-dependent carboligase